MRERWRDYTGNKRSGQVRRKERDGGTDWGEREREGLQRKKIERGRDYRGKRERETNGVMAMREMEGERRGGRTTEASWITSSLAHLFSESRHVLALHSVLAAMLGCSSSSKLPLFLFSPLS